MRVIAGKFRSRPLLAPPGLDTRPTADRLRETLFNVLTQGAANRVVDAAFLDLYAGSGAVGIEALSRGAASVTFVEQNTAALAVLRKNLDTLRMTGNNARVEKKSVGSFLRKLIENDVPEPVSGRFGVVFLDPPYALNQEYALTLGFLGGQCASLLAPGAIVVAEHRRKTPLEASYALLTRTRVIEQGDAGLSFYSLE